MTREQFKQFAEQHEGALDPEVKEAQRKFVAHLMENDQEIGVLAMTCVEAFEALASQARKAAR